MSMKTRRIGIRTLGLALVAALLAAVPAAAQTDITTGRFVGQIVDQDGQALPGVTVEARNKGTGLALTAVTDARGTYHIINVPVGTYDVTANLSGFQKQSRTGITVNLSSAITVDFKLGLATLAEAVTVTADAPVVETTQTASQVVVDNAAIQTLPITGRNFTDLVLTTPNAQRDPDRQNLSLGGQRGINTMVTVDGVDFNNAFFGGPTAGAEGRAPISISQEAVREFQVVLAGASAEYGRSGGGFVNVITKSGSNDFHGAALGYYRPSDWSAKLADGTDPKDSKRTNLGANLGGPLLRDRLFFFGSYEQQRQDTTNPVFSSVQTYEQILAAKYPGYPISDSTFVRGDNADNYFGRLDFQASDQHRVTGRASYTVYDGPNGTSSSGNQATGHNGIESLKSLSTVAQWNGMFGKSLINDLSVQYVKEDNPRLPQAAGANLPELQIFDGGPNLGGLYYMPITAKSDRKTIYDSVTVLSGNHVFKGGLEYNNTSMDQVFKGSWRGVFLFQSTTVGTTRYTALDNFKAGKWNEYREFIGLNGKTADEAGQYDEPQNEYGVFIQDQWFVSPKLTATIGLRYEYQQNPTTPVVDPRKVLNPASGIVQPDAKIPNATNQWSPRLSLAYAPDSKSVVRLSLGRYFARFPALLTSQLYTSNGVQGTQYIITGVGGTGPAAGQVAPGWGAAFDPISTQQLGNLPAGTKLAAPGIFVIDPDFQNSHTDLAVLGLERELMGISFGLEGQYSKGYNLERGTDLNLVASTTPAIDCPALDPASGVTCYGKYNPTTKRYATNRLNPAYGAIKMYTSDARSEFWSVTLKFRKSLANGLRFFGAVTRGSDKDSDSNERNYAGLFAEDLYNPDINWGYSDRDIKWRFLSNVSYDVKLTSRLSGFGSLLFNYQTGRPLNPQVGQDLNYDGNSVDRPTVNGAHFERNSFRRPDFYTLDLRVGVAFEVGPGRLSVFAECFNCTNTANRTMSNNTYGAGQTPNANFAIANGVTSTPRTLQGALRYDF